MFSGIVQQLAQLRTCSSRATDQSMRFSYQQAVQPALSLGDSICMNGVCLTATAVGKDYFDADVSAETLTCSTLGKITEGQLMNMESAIHAGDPLGGHLLTGHADAIATVRSIKEIGASKQLSFALEGRHQHVMRYIARKGSIAVDGVSLTVNDVSEASFEANIVPHTHEHTIAQYYRTNTEVNIEVDLIARYVARLLESDGTLNN